MEGKIAIIGAPDFVMPFSALGVDTFATSDTPDEIAENAKKIVKGNFALVVVAENIASTVEEAFVDYENLPTPCIIVVPFTTEPTGVATKTLGEALKTATGINILQNNQEKQ
jgi:vacuolar-type H+-ATPase subunit F/Vma7